MKFSIFYAIFLPFFMSLLIILINKKKMIKLPPGPKKLPIIGNLHQLGQLTHRSLQQLASTHGSLMFLQLGSVPAVVVSSADTAKEIFKSHDLSFSSRPTSYVGKRADYGSSITFAPYGEYWREARKIAILEVLSQKKVQSFWSIREDEVVDTIETIAKISLSENPIVDLSQLALFLITNVIRRVVFGNKGKNDEQEKEKIQFFEVIHEVHHLLGTVNVADYFPWMRWINKLNGVDARLDKNFKDLDIFFDQEIQEHSRWSRSNNQHEDLVDILLRLQSDPNQKLRLTNNNIKGFLKEIFTAGTETTSGTLVWIMTELIRNPSTMKKAQDEVRAIVKEKGISIVNESDLSKLEYLKMVIKEGLRLHPPIPLPFPHQTTENCNIKGFEIPAKTTVLFNLTSISTDPKYWENATEFKPERFLNNFVGQNFEYLPFGAGRRSCPGNYFALKIIELALANLLKNFDWRLPNGVKAEDIDMTEAIGLTAHKKTPLFLLASSPNL